MKTFLAVSMALTLAASAASAARADVMIADNHQTVAVDCAKDKAVSIVGNHATVTLTGTCERVNVAGNRATVKGAAGKVLVAGNHNTVDLDGVVELMVSGNKNTVSYKQAPTAKAPRVSNTGNDNKVSLRK